MLVVLSAVENNVRFSATTYVHSYYLLQTVLGAGLQFYAKSEHESLMDSRESKMWDKLKMANSINVVRHKEMSMKRTSRSLTDNVYSQETCMKILSILLLKNNWSFLLFDDAKKLDTA